jgi:uncharacterized protein YdhG (YjbR/CyaY superfamily)
MRIRFEARRRSYAGTRSRGDEELQVNGTEDDLVVSEGFSDAERQAMKERATELRAERGGRKKAQDLQALLDAIAEMPREDRIIAERVHAIVTRIAPHLLARTWYGMPAYADGKDVVCFFQGAAKFDTRYATIGFNDSARLDDGDMWPVSFAIVDWTDAVQQRVEGLVRAAVG